MLNEPMALELSKFLNGQQESKIFSRVDKDGNGEISHQEWMQFFDTFANEGVLSRKAFFMAGGNKTLLSALAPRPALDLKKTDWEAGFKKFSDGAKPISLRQWALQMSEERKNWSSTNWNRDRLWSDCCDALAQCVRRCYSTYLKAPSDNLPFREAAGEALKALTSLAQDQIQAPAQKKRCSFKVESVEAEAPVLPLECVQSLMDFDFGKNRDFNDLSRDLFTTLLAGPLDPATRARVDELRMGPLGNWDRAGIPLVNDLLWEVNLNYPNVELLNEDPWFVKVGIVWGAALWED